MRSPRTPTLERLRVAFMGSDDFSVPSLETCLAGSEVVAVYTQPDRRSGRGRKQASISPVKRLALERGLRIEQPETFDKPCSEELREIGPDLTVVAAYGHILPRRALEAARLDSINVHASLLPRHRGAAPIAAAILAGDEEAGVTIMKLRPELDAGEILCFGEDRSRAQRAVRIGERETAGELAQRLAALGGQLLADALTAFANGSVTYERQDDALATYAPELEKAAGRIDWQRPAGFVDRHIRAMTPWPGAFTELHAPQAGAVRLTVVQARRCECPVSRNPGAVDASGGRLVVWTADGCIELIRLKPAGRAEMSAADFVRGCAALRNQPGGCWVGNG